MPRSPKPTEAPAKTDPPAEKDAVAEEPEVTPEAYEAARMALVAKLPPKADRPTSIYGKLALATSLIGQIKKSGRNTFHNYTYARESDLVEAIRPLLSELGLWIWWSLYSDPEKGFVHHERVSLSKKKDGVTNEVESLTVITGEFCFIDEAGNESKHQIMMGYGDDNSDKGLYKALTGMEKYFLFKSFLVSTGDDPEADTRSDQRAANRERGSSPRTEVRSGSGPVPGNGGRQGTASNPQLRQLGEISRAAGLGSTMAAITVYEKILDPDKIEPLDPEDLAGSLAAWLGKQSGPVLGKLIHEVKALADAGKGDKASPDADAAAAPIVDQGLTRELTENDVEVHSDGTKDTVGEESQLPDPSLEADASIE